jgi:hypothetical protein
MTAYILPVSEKLDHFRFPLRIESFIGHKMEGICHSLEGLLFQALPLYSLSLQQQRQQQHQRQKQHKLDQPLHSFHTPQLGRKMSSASIRVATM